MKKITDKELLRELQRRFTETKRSLEAHASLLNELQVVNTKLKESEAVKTQFLSNIRNEINNPLSSILGLSQDIRSGKIDLDHVYSNAKLIFEEAFNLDFQLRNIFFAAEIEAGEVVPHIVNVNLFAHISNLIDSFSHLVEKKKITVHLKCNNTDELHFNTDTEKLHLIVSNLLFNAIEYSPVKSDINITIRMIENRKLEISVQDFGTGISEKDIEVIFDRFTQVDSGASKLHRGHGLGLAITRSLLDLLDGKITVSCNEETGTVFSILLNEGETTANPDEFSSDGNEFLFEESEVF